MAAATAAGGDWRGAPANARAPFSSRRGGGRGGGSALAVMSSGASPGTLAYATGSAFDGRAGEAGGVFFVKSRSGEDEGVVVGDGVLSLRDDVALSFCNRACSSGEPFLLSDAGTGTCTDWPGRTDGGTTNDTRRPS